MKFIIFTVLLLTSKLAFSASFLDYVNQSDVDSHLSSILDGLALVTSLLILVAGGVLIVDFVKRSTDQAIESDLNNGLDSLQSKQYLDDLKKRNDDEFQLVSEFEKIHDSIDLDTLQVIDLAGSPYSFAQSDSHGLVCLDSEFLYTPFEAVKEQLEEELFFNKSTPGYRDIRINSN